MQTPLDNIHVYPVNDLKEHDIETMDCWCNPDILNDLPPYVIKHHSMDGREKYEQYGN